MQEAVYFRDVDYPDVIVRKRREIFELEYIPKWHPIWEKTEPDSPYEREFYFGEGDNCLSPITYEEARVTLAEWGVEIWGNRVWIACSLSFED